jgi:hypothetical protein
VGIILTLIGLLGALVLATVYTVEGRPIRALIACAVAAFGLWLLMREFRRKAAELRRQGRAR